MNNKASTIKAVIDDMIIRKNIAKLRTRLRQDVKICAVLKSNAYSFGDVKVAQTIYDIVDCFAVSHLVEATRLRRYGINKQILLLGVCQDFNTAIKLDLVITICSTQEMRALVKFLKQNPSSDKNVSVHLEINTGMNRYGISSMGDMCEIIKLAKSTENITMDGIYTHFSHEESDLKKINEQLEFFAPFRRLFKQHFPDAVIHAACSGSAHYLPAQFDMVRIGKSLYGGYHGYETAITVTSPIIAIQDSPRLKKVGYAGEGIATKVGIIPCGYADLAHFTFANKHSVLVKDNPHKIVGRVCMDCLMIDVSNIDEPLGSEVMIIGPYEGVRIMDICRKCGVIACDLLCSFNFQRTLLIHEPPPLPNVRRVR